jgi:hypothetical protein
VSRRRFSTSGPKGKRGTVVAFRLRAPAMVVFTVHGPSPSCGVAGKKAVRGHRGINRVHLNGRFGDHTLGPGTYEIVVVARRGKAHKRVGRISVQVVRPGSRVRRPGSAPAFRCTPSSFTAGIPGATLFVSSPAQNRGVDAPPQAKAQPAKTPGRSGVLAEPPFRIRTGNGAMDTLLTVLLYGTLALGATVLFVYVVRYFRDPFRRYN